MIPVGFELVSGEPVSIPYGHTVIVGQSQHAGKTTTLEALATRCGRKVIAFVTKRGEGSFRVAHEIPPYYEDSVDWRTIRGLCESITEERLDRMQRQSIRAICRAGQFGRGKSLVSWEKPKSIADLREIVDKILEKASGTRELIYSEIADDLTTVAEEIVKLPKTDSVDLIEGLNVVDLEPFEFQLKSLVVRSFIQWVHQHAKNTIAIARVMFRSALPPRKNGSVSSKCPLLSRTPHPIVPKPGIRPAQLQNMMKMKMVAKNQKVFLTRSWPMMLSRKL